MQDTGMETVWRDLGVVTACAGARGAVALAGKIFAAGEDGRLYRVDPERALAEPLGDGGWRARLLAAGHGRLFAVEESGSLYAVDPAHGEDERLDGDGFEISVASGADDALFVSDGILHTLAADGSRQQLGERSFSPRLLFPGPRSLHVLEQDGSLLRVSLEDGSTEQLDGDWSDVTAGAVLGEALYVTSEAGWMYAVSMAGDCIPLACGAPAATRFLLASGRSLFAIEGGGGLHVLSLG